MFALLVSDVKMCFIVLMLNLKGIVR